MEMLPSVTEINSFKSFSRSYNSNLVISSAVGKRSSTWQSYKKEVKNNDLIMQICKADS